MKRACFSIVCLLLLTSLHCGSVYGGVVADSITGFSGIQGQNSWYYGYYDGRFESSGFHLMTQYIPGASYGPGKPGAWVVDATSYWTAIWDEAQACNGQDGLGRQPGEQWAVRRWVSTVGGSINISGRVAQIDNPPGLVPGGDGVTAYMIINGAEVWSQWVSGYDVLGADYSVNTSCSPGSIIDLVLSPGATGVCDHFNYTATISTVPEPSSILTLLCGAGGLTWFRKRKS